MVRRPPNTRTRCYFQRTVITEDIHLLLDSVVKPGRQVSDLQDDASQLFCVISGSNLIFNRVSWLVHADKLGC